MVRSTEPPITKDLWDPTKSVIHLATLQGGPFGRLEREKGTVATFGRKTDKEQGPHGLIRKYWSGFSFSFSFSFPIFFSFFLKAQMNFYFYSSIHKLIGKRGKNYGEKIPSTESRAGLGGGAKKEKKVKKVIKEANTESEGKFAYWSCIKIQLCFSITWYNLSNILYIS